MSTAGKVSRSRVYYHYVGVSLFFFLCNLYHCLISLDLVLDQSLLPIPNIANK